MLHGKAMRFIDIHPHIISPDTDKYPRAPLGGSQSKWSSEHTMTFEQMVREMDETGVERSVLVQAATCYGYDNSYVADAVAAFPDRLGGVFTIDAVAPDAPQKMKHWVSRGLSGVRLFTKGSTMPNQATWFAEEAAFPFWETAGELGIPVCITMSWTAIDRLRAMLVRFPHVRVILDHLSRPPMDDHPVYAKAAGFFALAECRNLYLKITPVNVMEIEQAGATDFLPRVVRTFGADRVAWGSNYPSSGHTLHEAWEINWKAASSLTEEERRKIFRETALSLYPCLVAA
jgi:L-fuconolactonase